MSESPNPHTFKAFEHRRWQSAVFEYARGFGHLTPQAARPLLEAVGCGPGVDLVDLASGPGYVAAVASTQGARVVGLDFSRAMVEEARSRHPEVTFEEGDVEALPFEEARFDAAVMNFGVLHLARPDQSFREALRVLRPGGRSPLPPGRRRAKRSPSASSCRPCRRAATRTCRSRRPPFFRFGDAGECERSLVAAGFVRPFVTRVEQTWHLASTQALLDVFERGTVRTAGLLGGQTPEALEAIRQAIGESARAYAESDGSLRLPMPGSARRGHAPLTGRNERIATPEESAGRASPSPTSVWRHVAAQARQKPAPTIQARGEDALTLTLSHCGGRGDRLCSAVGEGTALLLRWARGPAL